MHNLSLHLYATHQQMRERSQRAGAAVDLAAATAWVGHADSALNSAAIAVYKTTTLCRLARRQARSIEKAPTVFAGELQPRSARRVDDSQVCQPHRTAVLRHGEAARRHSIVCS